MLFDSHTHLQFAAFEADREKVIEDLKEANVKVINVGTNLEDSKLAIDLANQYPGRMWATVGLHPNDAPNSSFVFNDYKEITQDEHVVAIGECGLDYFRTEGGEAREKQKEIFIRHIELARELKKPLMIHSRPKEGGDAYLDILEILKAYNLNLKSGNGTAHFFAGSKETAKEFLDLGFFISFAGPITFPPKADQPRAGANAYREVVEYVPLDKILIETDAPFAAPVPHRGKRNDPAFVEFVARKIAEWKNLDYKKVVGETYQNAVRLFEIQN